MSSRKEYVKLWLSYEAYFEAYTPEQIGRLVLAMLAYKDTGRQPELLLGQAQLQAPVPDELAHLHFFHACALLW